VINLYGAARYCNEWNKQGQILMANDQSGDQKYILHGNIEAYTLIGMMVLAAVFYFLIPYQIEKPKLLFGRAFMDMKPTLFPALAAIGMFVLSGVALIQSLRNPLREPFKGLDRQIIIQLSVIIVILYLFAISFEPLGYWLSGIMVSFSLSLYLGNRNIWTLALLSLGVPSFIYFVFTRLLLVSLPEGVVF
jgi:putative tricarboxylic transport membrane protein